MLFLSQPIRAILNAVKAFDWRAVVYCTSMDELPECTERISCLNELPDFGLSGLHGEGTSVNAGPAPFFSSLKEGGSSSLSVKSSAPDSTPECSGEVTFTSSLSSSGGGRLARAPSEGEGGV